MFVLYPTRPPMLFVPVTVEVVYELDIVPLLNPVIPPISFRPVTDPEENEFSMKESDCNVPAIPPTAVEGYQLCNGIIYGSLTNQCRRVFVAETQ
jgi:hypothetical protein